MSRFDQCDATCTTDCGHCKGAHRWLTSCRDCPPDLELVVQTDSDQVPYNDPMLWADLVENITGDVVPATHDTSHRLAYEPAIGEPNA